MVKIVKNPVNGRLNNLNDPVLNALSTTPLRRMGEGRYNSIHTLSLWALDEDG